MIQGFLPRLAAVGRFVNTPVLVVRPFVSRGGDVDNVGVGRMNHDPRDRVRAGQAHVGPGGTGVGRLVDSGTRHRAAKDVRLAQPDPHRVLVRGRDGDVTDRCGNAMLEDRCPGGSLVVCLPDAARSGGDVDRVALATRRRDCHIGHTAADVRRAEELPLEVLELRGLFHRHVLLVPGQTILRIGETIELGIHPMTQRLDFPGQGINALQQFGYLLALFFHLFGRLLGEDVVSGESKKQSHCDELRSSPRFMQGTSGQSLFILREIHGSPAWPLPARGSSSRGEPPPLTLRRAGGTDSPAVRKQ